jgi:2-desacetyl-2-hydroxyethyl bacteriochlorophyllide A dehydrogenase
MKTIILDKPGQFQLVETEPPAGPLPGQAVVRVRRVGICGTDIHAFKGDQPFFSYPRILGHELGVEVVSVASELSSLKAGDYCAVEPYLNCGVCIACRRGRPNCCVELKCLGVHTDGGMRELITVPAVKLHRSSTLTLEQLALVETLGIGAHAVERASLQPGEFALVIGAGPIGLAVIQFAQLAGARVIVLDVNEDRLNFCRHQFRADWIVTAGAGTAMRLREITSGDMPTAVFDATGNRQSMMQAFDWVANSGRLILVGLMLGDVSFHDPDAHRRELTLLCSRNATAANFQRIISLMESGQIDSTPWITHRASIASMIEAFPAWIDPSNKVIKAMVDIEGG